MKDYLASRTIEEAAYIIKYNATIRQTASHFYLSKSTIFTDISLRLPLLDKILHEKVQKILTENKNQRHIRGGESTRKKFKNL